MTPRRRSSSLSRLTALYAPPKLERTDPLEVLALEKHLCATRLVEKPGGGNGGPMRYAGNAVGGGENILKVDHVLPHCAQPETRFLGETGFPNHEPLTSCRSRH